MLPRTYSATGLMAGTVGSLPNRGVVFACTSSFALYICKDSLYRKRCWTSIRAQVLEAFLCNRGLSCVLNRYNNLLFAGREIEFKQTKWAKSSLLCHRVSLVLRILLWPHDIAVGCIYIKNYVEAILGQPRQQGRPRGNAAVWTDAAVLCELPPRCPHDGCREAE